MLIPSIDLQGGRVVQLEQGERVRWASDDVDAWIEAFHGFPLVQVIDLDAARGTGRNAALVARACAALPCQVGGGVRTPDAAQALLDAGARRVILGSCLYDERGANADRARAFADRVGTSRVVAAIDSRGGTVVIRGWRATTDTTPADAIRVLDPHVGAFLYTHVDSEGLLTGLDRAVIETLRRLTARGVIAAGGIRGPDEVDALDRMGVDAVVGMAIYTGTWAEKDWRARRANPR
jgi:phosphoribosylformimino-5-aminoimidazole carboxamide ribotide isomerase